MLQGFGGGLQAGVKALLRVLRSALGRAFGLRGMLPGGAGGAPLAQGRFAVGQGLQHGVLKLVPGHFVACLGSRSAGAVAACVQPVPLQGGAHGVAHCAGLAQGAKGGVQARAQVQAQAGQVGAVGQHRLAQCGAQLCVGPCHIGAACQQVGGLHHAGGVGHGGQGHAGGGLGGQQGLPGAVGFGGGGCAACQHGQGRTGAVQCGLGLGDGGLGLFALGLGGQVFASVGQACALTGLQQGVAALQHVAFFVQPGQVVLVQAQQHVVAHHLSLQQGFGTVGGGGSGIGLALGHGTGGAHAAKQVDLPRHHLGDGAQALLGRAVQALVVRVHLGQRGALGLGLGAQAPLGQGVARGQSGQGAGLAHSGHSGLAVLVVLHGGLHQGVELLVLQGVPPVAAGGAGGQAQGGGGGQGGAVAFGGRADGAGGRDAGAASERQG